MDVEGGGYGDEGAEANGVQHDANMEEGGSQPYYDDGAHQG